MGEIGRDRDEFLHDMLFWEINSIIRGYRQRNILQYQLQRLQAYHACFSMRDNKDGLTPTEWMPLYFDEKDMPTPVTEEEQQEMIAEMEALQLI